MQWEEGALNVLDSARRNRGGLVGGWNADGLSGMDIVNAENSALSNKKRKESFFARGGSMRGINACRMR